jgi:hypothetical protein
VQIAGVRVRGVRACGCVWERVGFWVSALASGCPLKIFGQVFEQGRSYKCSKQVFDSRFGLVCQNFEPNLGNFQPNPKNFEPNPDRILELLVFNRILNWFVASSGITRSVSGS